MVCFQGQILVPRLQVPWLGKKKAFANVSKSVGQRVQDFDRIENGEKIHGKRFTPFTGLSRFMNPFTVIESFVGANWFT